MTNRTFPEIDTKGKEAIRVFSFLNGWIDAIIFVKKEDVNNAKIKIEKAIEEFWSSEECYGDLMERHLKDIDHESVYHDSCDEDEDYEEKWNTYILELHDSFKGNTQYVY